MFHFRKWPRWRDSESKVWQIARFVILGLIFALVIWGFSANNKRLLQKIQDKAPAKSDKRSERDAPASPASLADGSVPEHMPGHTDRHAADGQETPLGRAEVHDGSNTLTPRQAESLRDFVEDMRYRHGVAISVDIDDALTPTDLIVPRGNELCIAICPVRREAAVQASPRVAAALGEDLLEELADGHFAEYFAAERWPDGLAAALYKIQLRLEEQDEAR